MSAVRDWRTHSAILAAEREAASCMARAELRERRGDSLEAFVLRRQAAVAQAKADEGRALQDHAPITQVAGTWLAPGKSFE